MGETLGSIKSCCLQLEERAVKARTTAADRLCALLSNARICAQIDDAGRCGGVRDWCWQDVYSSTWSFMKLEAEKLVTDESKNVGTLATRENKKKSMVGFLKLVLNKGRLQLAWGSVINDLLGMLEMPHMRRLISSPLTRLLADFLKDPMVRALVKAGDWAHLLNQLHQLVNDAPPGLEKSLVEVVSLLCSVLTHGPEYSCMNKELTDKGIWRLVKSLLLLRDDIMRPESDARLESIRVANILIHQASLDCRREACRLGEDTVQVVVRSWADRREGSEAVLEFLQLQMAVHHPLGASLEEEGAMYIDQPTWSKQLARIYRNVVDTTIRNRARQRGNRGGGSRALDIELEPALLELSVAVVHQLLVSPTAVDLADVTQLVPLETTQTGPAAKRRRVSSAENQGEFRLETLIAEVMGIEEGRGKGGDARLMWLQILSSLIQKHPGLLGVEQAETVLKALASLLQTSRNPLLRRHALAAAHWLLESDLCSGSQEWDAVSRQALNMLSINQAGAEGHMFVRCLLEEGKLLAEQVTDLYSRSLVKQDKASLTTFELLLKRWPPKEDMREKLLTWLLPAGEEDGGRVGGRTLWEEGQLVASILKNLVVKKLGENREMRRKKGEPTRAEKQLLELALLRNINEKESCEILEENRGPAPVILTNMTNLVQEVLIQEAGELIETLHGQPESLPILQEVIHVGGTILLYVSLLEKHSSLQPRLASVASDILKTCGAASSKMLAKTGHNCKPMLEAWAEIGGRGEVLPEGLVKQLETAVERVVELRQKEQKDAMFTGSQQDRTMNASRGSGDNFELDDFDDFSNGSDSGTVDNLQDESLDLGLDVGKDVERDLAQVSSCLKLLANHAVASTQDRELKQVKVVELLINVLDCHNHYSSSVLDLCIPIVSIFANSPHLADRTVEQLVVQLVKNLAAASVNKTKLHVSGVLTLLKLMEILAPRLDQLPPCESRPHLTFCRVLQGIVMLSFSLDKRRLGHAPAQALVLVVGAIAMLNAPTWAVWSAGQYLTGVEGEQHIAKCLPGFLRHPSAEVRLCAATRLTHLKPANGSVWLESSLRPYLQKSGEGEGEKLPTSLALFASLSQEQPSLVTQLLTAMFDVARQAQDSTLLSRATALVASSRGTDPYSLLLSRLSRLLASHMQSGEDLQQFPCFHFGFDQSKIQEFLQSQEKTVVPAALLHEPTKDRLNSIATLLNRTPAELLKVNMSGLALHFIPGVVATDVGIQSPGLEKMLALANLVEDQMGSEAFNTAVENHYLATLEHVFSTAFDSNHLSDTFGFDPELEQPSETPCLNASMPKAMVQFYHRTFLEEGEVSLWSKCAKGEPDLFFKMLSLVSSTFNDRGLSTPARLRAIHSLWLFLDEMTDHLGEADLQPLLPAFVLMPSSSLLHLLHASMNQSLLRAGLKTLHKLVSIVTPVAAGALQPVIFSVNYCIVALISDHENLAPQAMDILNFLFVSNGFRFGPVMQQLEDFPSTEAFSQLQAAIERERKSKVGLNSALESFLEVAEITEPPFLLVPLRAMLARLQTELVNQALDSNLLRRLFATLMQVARSEKEEAGRVALKCLGELGPLSLDSPLLQEPDQGRWCTTPEFSCVGTMMLQLKKLLLGPEGTVSRVASTAISNILSCTREGADWLTPQPGEEVSALQELFAPFQRPVALKKETHTVRVDVQKVRQGVDLPAVWGGTDLHGPWLTKLVQTLLDCFAKNTSMKLLADVCDCSLEVCRLLLPFIIHELLLVDYSDVRIIVSKKMNDFFRAHFEEVAKCPSSLSTCSISPHLRPQSIGALLDVVIHLRQQAMPSRLATRGQNCWESNYWLADINYLHCARAALSCDRPTDAIQLASIWCFQKERESRKAQMSGGSLLESLNGEVQQVLYKASTMLGDTDSALGTGLNLDPEGLGLLLPFCDAQAATGSSEARQGLVGALYGSGLHHTLSMFLGSRLTSPEERQVQEECAWRLQQWDTFSPETARKSVPGCLLGALASSGDLKAVKYWRDLGEEVIRTSLQGVQLVTTTTLHPILTQLRQLGELGVLVEAGGEAQVDRLLSRDEKRVGNFGWLEPVLTQRQVLATNCKHLKPVKEKLALHASRAARAAQQHWICEQQFRQLDPSLDLRWEKVLVAWSQGKRSSAVSLSKKLLLELEAAGGKNSEKMLPQVMLQLGKWLDHQKTETSRNILEKYLARCVSLFERGGSASENLVRAHLALAQFADKQFKQVKEYMGSGEFQERQEGALRIQRDAKLLQGSRNVDKAIGTALTIKSRFASIDKEDGELAKQEADEYLGLALQSYLAILRQGNGSRSQAAVYRLVALWFANAESNPVLKCIPNTLPKVPSWKFVPLLYQLAARMEVPRQGSNDSTTALYNLVLRSTQEHPHHALPIILALIHAKEDEKRLLKGKNLPSSAADGRGVAASKIAATVKKFNEKSKRMIERYSFLSLGLIDLAYVVTPNKSTGQIPFPNEQTLRKVKDWADVVVPTDTLPAAPDGNYSSISGIAKFIPSYSMVGGINAPKKIRCVGADGRLRLQLVKGSDDLRQDCVMEQVFGLLNQLLDQDEDSHQQKLSIRTYKVVPLSQRSGVLQWCTDTEPLAVYLVGADNRGGAHKKYFPKQLDSQTCRTTMAACKNKPDKEKVFLEICANFSPAMKYFFLEKFPTSGAYYLARTAYTKSAATNSMVGHILGIGDRHNNNILIDNVTGELIHIDLGIAFEQGKILPTPEKIPFRLSRDIVDGFGPAGVEGVFRKNCERTMQVLREHKAALVTVLEVLLHDPLFNWSVGPSKAAAKQDAGKWEEMRKEEAGQGNRMASRALIVVSGKLDGREEGASLSVEGQVSTLIQKATDPANLSAIFEGWAAWC